MKKTLFILVIILCANVVTTKAQDSVTKSKNEFSLMTEFSVNPSNFDPTDLRGGIGLKIHNDSMSTELLVSYERFYGTENQIYKKIDFSLIRLASFKNHPKLSAGLGISLGGVVDYGASMGGFAKGECKITNFLAISGQIGFAGAQRLGYGLDGKLNLIFIF